MEADLAYYRRRSEQERAAAAIALDAKARQMHLELADTYERRIARIEVEDSAERPGLVPAA